ncbi:hypothetical protein OHA72_56510 [Dactylosporangium sp. NBC_01737]|uniref:hypothetical protein n=1 Tax=Dactylosporangium sp. NBC_01737 TaxID=2975959 RepID=UPI002E0FF953|nr:hypothetical protein OHA72_56510 [Dactylosporangium sp. NBC_01737]
MAAGDEVAVPAQDSVGADEEPQSVEHVDGQLMQQRCQERSIGRVEPHLLVAQLALQHHDLVA